MASSRNSRPGDGAPGAVQDDVSVAMRPMRRGRERARTPGDVQSIVAAAIAALLAAKVVDGARVAVALSGGIDSMVLLDAAHAVATSRAIMLSAVHVQHGLSPNAEVWARFCAEQCAQRGIPLLTHHLQLERKGGESLEAVARSARHEVFARAGVDALMLAHHADDQAETLLLQLLRGAGPHGLASMPRHRPGTPALLRPLLHITRVQLAAYAAARALSWVDDESNADQGFRRNFLRAEVTPRLIAAFPGYPATVVRAASHQAEAALLLDELASCDAQGALDRERIARARLVALSPPRARNLLRWFLQREGLRPPSTARLGEMLRQICTASAGARTRLVHDGAEIGCHRGSVVVHAATGIEASGAFEHLWKGETEVRVPGGTVVFERTRGEGLDATRLASMRVMLRPRIGGERIRLAANRPQQTVKKLLQASGTPPWERRALPLVWCDNALALVPTIGVAVEFQASPGQPGWRVEWQPRRTPRV